MRGGNKINAVFLYVEEVMDMERRQTTRNLPSLYIARRFLCGAFDNSPDFRKIFANSEGVGGGRDF